jgi:hypothetical protein
VGGIDFPQAQSLGCQRSLITPTAIAPPDSIVATIIATSSANVPPVRVIPSATPTAPIGATTLSWVVQNRIVTSMYEDANGTIFFGAVEGPDGLADPFHAQASLWEKPANGEPFQLSDWIYGLIGGIVVHNGTIYFNQAGALMRMPIGARPNSAEVILHYPILSEIYGHLNHSLVPYKLNGEDVLLMAVGSVIDSSYDTPLHPSGIQYPYYEPFPTGRILYAKFPWLDSVRNYQVVQGSGDDFEEYARGFRNPWGMAVGVVDGRTRVFVADNDPAFTPEKYDSNPANAGDELNELFQSKNYGHPFLYAGREPALGMVPPIVVFPDGSVPSGVAIANGQVFVALDHEQVVVRVDVNKRTYATVIDNVQPFNIFGYGNLLYVVDFSGIRVIDVRTLVPHSPFG